SDLNEGSSANENVLDRTFPSIQSRVRFLPSLCGFQPRNMVRHIFVSPILSDHRVSEVLPFSDQPHPRCMQEPRASEDCHLRGLPLFHLPLLRAHSNPFS